MDNAAMHRQRWLTSITALPVVLGLVWAGGWAFWGLVALVNALALWEGIRLSRALERGRSPGGPGTTAALIAAGSLFLAAAQHGSWGGMFGVVTTGFLASGVAAVVRFDGDAAVAREAFGWIATLVYVSGLLGFVVLLRGGHDGAVWIYLLLALAFAGDTGAYYAGSRWGRRKLCPRVSPGKTVEGALGGALLTLAVGAVFRSLWLPHLAWGAALLTFGAVAVVAPLGDLFASMLKRSGGIKDSGALLPGHGGLLDRIDALLFAAPVVYAARAVLI